MTATAPYGGAPRGGPAAAPAYAAPTGSALPDPWDVVGGTGKSLNSMFNHKDEYGQNQSAPIGTSVEGVVATLPETFQRTNFDTKEPMFWPDGRPQLGIRFQADTGYRDDAEDDGRRSVSFQGTLLRALQDEMRAKGVKQFGVGTQFRITLVGLEPTKKGFPKKIYKVDLAPQPLSNPAADAVLGGGAPQYQPAVAPATTTAWAPTQVPQAPVQQQVPQQQVPQYVQPQPFPAQPQAPAQQQFPVQQPPVGAGAVQQLLGGVEVPQQQVAPSAIPVITQEQVNNVQMLISRNIPRQEALLAVANGDEQLAALLDQNVPF